MRALNRKYRGKNSATDVLSFDSDRYRPTLFAFLRARGAPLPLALARRLRRRARAAGAAVVFIVGDIVIATGVARRQAAEAGHSYQSELRRARAARAAAPPRLRPSRSQRPRPDGAPRGDAAPQGRPGHRPHRTGSGAGIVAQRARGRRRHDCPPAAPGARRHLRRHDRDRLQRPDAAVAAADGRARRPRRSPRVLPRRSHPALRAGAADARPDLLARHGRARRAHRIRGLFLASGCCCCLSRCSSCSSSTCCRSSSCGTTPRRRSSSCCRRSISPPASCIR